jgi:hypothetical protein
MRSSRHATSAKCNGGQPSMFTLNISMVSSKKSINTTLNWELGFNRKSAMHPPKAEKHNKNLLTIVIHDVHDVKVKWYKHYHSHNNILICLPIKYHRNTYRYKTNHCSCEVEWLLVCYLYMYLTTDLAIFQDKNLVPHNFVPGLQYITERLKLMHERSFKII